MDNNYENEDYGQSVNPKLTTSWDLLSSERQKEINNILVATIKKFEDSDKLEFDKIYPFELTHGFDQENPIQYIYLMCAFRLKKLDKPLVQNDLVKVTSVIDISVQEIEVFKEENMYNWIDHVNRIEKSSKENKENQLFYEDNIFNKETESNNKQKEKKFPNQCNINKPNDDTKKIDIGDIGSVIEKSFMQNNDTNSNNNNNNNNVDDYLPHGIPKNELFDFYKKEEPIRTNQEYIDMFNVYSRKITNDAMTIYYFHKLDENETLVKSLHSLKNLQLSFSNCDFWKFTKNELGQFGFMNWSDELMLIPVWVFPVVLKNSKDKKVHTPINEEVLIRNIDFNLIPATKYGCVPYGLKINELPK